MIDMSLLTQPVQELLKLNAPNAYRSLVVTGGYAPAKELLKSLSAASIFTKPVVRSDEAQSVLAGLWLWHDWLDESHTISQGIHTATGSYWHAILHRREGDFSNSKYWYAKAASHPVRKAIAPKAAEVVRSSKVAQHVSAVLLGGWDPDALVDLVEEASGVKDDPKVETLIALQRAEWDTLFEMNITAATKRRA
ncbi:hypothetical protein BH10PLA1_BH10PLA1_22220 [soil metagenome]